MMATSQTTSSPECKAESFKSGENFLFEGVNPECVQGRFFHSELQKKERSVVITEYIPQKCSTDPSQNAFVLSSIVPLPDAFFSNQKDRHVGKLYCIGCCGNTLVIQYITLACKYIRFLIIDLLKRNVRLFEDSERYLKKDFHLVCPLECIIDDKAKVILLRLPQRILSKRKWSKVLTVDISSTSEDSSEGFETCIISGTKSAPFGDRRFQCLRLYNLKPGSVVAALVNEFCSKVKFTVYDMLTNKKTHESTYSYGLYSTSLEQVSGSFCRSGEIFVICAVVVTEDGESLFHDKRLNIFLHAGSDFRLIAVHTLSITSLPELGCSYSPMFSQSDSCLSVWYLDVQGNNSEVFTRLLPKEPNLKNLSRAAILKCVYGHDLESLPLPSDLKNFLHFL